MAVLRNPYPPNIPPAGADPLFALFIAYWQTLSQEMLKIASEDQEKAPTSIDLLSPS
jgi:hypothetical protein